VYGRGGDPNGVQVVRDTWPEGLSGELDSSALDEETFDVDWQADDWPEVYRERFFVP
jgi:hypothetical protein